ncbi:MAG TPA: hypothetical protein VN493_14250 [Thermoanaerobaculia bacterium]|nr:hypothetical protein [Thermoanaerobaculia bacterium]
MASPVKLYQREMHDNLGFFPTWLPGDRIEIGDVGILEGGRFRRMTSLAELGIAGKTEAGAATQDVQYTSSEGTKIATTAGAEVTAVAKAEITVDFTREGAFVFHASRLRPQYLENRAAVGQEIVKVYKKGQWQKEWLLVEALHTADRATIIVSEDSSAGLVLVASAETPLSSISLADPKVGLKIAATHGKVVHIIGGKGLHPLYSCLRVKDPLFGAPSVQPVRGAGASGNEVPFARPGIDELLDS